LNAAALMAFSRGDDRRPGDSFTFSTVDMVKEVFATKYKKSESVCYRCQPTNKTPSNFGLEAEWPDWANFRLLGDGLIWVVLWKLQKLDK
jgi:hypothetical protein